MTNGGAALAEELCDVGRRGTAAFLVAEVEKPDADGHDVALDENRTVTPLIPPLLSGRVGCRPVDLDANPIGLIEIVQMTASALAADAGLAPCGGQAVRPLHTSDITQLKEGQRTLACIAKREFYIPAPAELRPGVKGYTNPGSRRSPPAYRLTDPGICLVEGRRGLDQVEDGLFDSGAWR